MRHLKKGKKLSRESGPRRALLKSLVSSIVVKGKVRTSLVKAKTARPILEKLITKAKGGTIAQRRQIGKFLGSKASEKLFKDIAPKYSSRNGGYLRITKISSRKSDGSRQAIIELV